MVFEGPISCWIGQFSTRFHHKGCPQSWKTVPSYSLLRVPCFSCYPFCFRFRKGCYSDSGNLLPLHSWFCRCSETRILLFPTLCQGVRSVGNLPPSWACWFPRRSSSLRLAEAAPVDQVNTEKAPVACCIMSYPYLQTTSTLHCRGKNMKKW